MTGEEERNPNWTEDDKGVISPTEETLTSLFQQGGLLSAHVS